MNLYHQPLLTLLEKQLQGHGESYSEIAKSIGEAVYYNDNDLYTAAVKIARDNFRSGDLRRLPFAAKLELAKRLHYDYNASAKQLQRLISVETDLLAAII